MFEDALLDSSPRQTSVLRRIHYLFSALAAALVFAQGMYLMPLLLAPVGQRALFIAAAMVGVAAALYTLMLSYVWAETRQQHQRTWPWLGITLLLNLPGFLIYLVHSARKSGDWKRAAIPLAYVTESMLVGVLILVPLIYTQALPKQFLIGELHIFPPPGRPPAPPASPQATPEHHSMLDTSVTPVYIPKGIAPVVEPPAPPPAQAGLGPGVIGAPPGGSSGGPLNWVLGSLPGDKEAPVPPPAHAIPKQQMIRVGGNVIAAQALYQPSPVYPPLAIMAHVQGTVVLQAILGKDGTVQDLKVLSGHPLLVRAAMEAVRTWRYQPTLLNGDAVDVLTEISVNFTLAQ